MRKILAVLALAIPITAVAEGLYGGVGYGITKYKEDDVPTANLNVLSFKLGTFLRPNFAVEARLGTGVGDDTVTYLGVPIKVELDNYYGFYGRAFIPTGTAFRPYGLIGWAKGELTASALGVSASEDDSDFSYGLGADVELTKAVALTLEYARLFKGEGYKVDGFSAGVAFRF